VANQPVTFQVSRGDGQLSVFPQEGGSVTVTTDANGIAAARLALGGRAGAGNYRVRASAAGFGDMIESCVLG
nr:hypothetical protein [Pseudomonadota bacterium]